MRAMKPYRRERRHSATHSSPQHYVELNGALDVQAAYLAMKEPIYLIFRRLIGARSKYVYIYVTENRGLALISIKSVSTLNFIMINPHTYMFQLYEGSHHRAVYIRNVQKEII
jgi:hypothetical protein